MIHAIFVLIFSFAIGQLIIMKTNEKFSVRRDPAAIRQNYDFTNLRGTALDIAVKHKMLGDLEVVKTADNFGVSFGHFAFSTSDGQKFLGCEYYEKVVAVFEAEGSATSGQKSTMEISGPCKYTENLAKIQPALIPIKKIMAELPQDGEMSFQGELPVNIKFQNLTDSWPTQWSLVNVRMEAPQFVFIIDRNEITKIMGQPLLISVR
ncbi:MAG: hypothetical protein JNL11_14595 [Bdellovibrionaceae bacterium]|nr:hypothetical protein [Pseudobdellovibrionaceae bacterium]